MGAKSIRKSLLLGVTGTVGLVMAVGGCAVYFVMKRSSLVQFDHALVEHAELVEASLVWAGGRVKYEGGAYRVNEENEEFDIFQAWLAADGVEVARSPALKGDALQRPVGAGSEPEFVAIMAPWGEPMRAVRLSFLPAAENPAEDPVPESMRVELMVAHALGELEDSLGRLRLALGAVGVVIFLALAAAIFLIVARALRPLGLLTEELKQRDEGRLDAPLAAVTRMPGELKPMVATFNGLLERIRHSFERERQFTSSAAHELRTPLAGLISRLEQATRRARAGDDYRVAIEGALATARDMNGLVERLLSLARLGGPAVTTEISEVPVGLLVAGALEVFAPDAARKRLQILCSLPDGATMRTDPALFQIVLNNLVENAVNYTNDGGEIALSFRSEGGSHILTVSNTGSELGATQVGEVFEPFWRQDQGRTEAAVHAGLGLAITKKIVELLGGKISVTSEKGGRFVATARFSGEM